MTIAVFGGSKGGCGKSSHAVNNVVWRMQEGRDVLLVDTDPQGSATLFCSDRNENEVTPAITPITLPGDGIARSLLNLKSRYDDIIVDTQGANSVEMRIAMTVADLLVIPCRPARFDSATMVAMNQTIADTRIVNPKLRAVAFINQKSPNPRSSRASRTRDFILEYCPNIQLLDTEIVSRLAYADLADFGMALDELNPRDNQAIAEARALYQEVWNEH